MKNIPKLTELEITIMGVMWDQDEDMTIHEIAECFKQYKLSPASVSQAMKHLLKKGAVTVGEHKRVANVYARTFHPNFGRMEFARCQMERLGGMISAKRQLGMVGIMAELLEEDTGVVSREELDELWAIIHSKKKS